MSETRAEMIPSIPPYGRQLFICTNGNCAGAEDVTDLLRQLGALHRKHGMNRFSNPARIVHVPCGCLGVCTNGPILVVYPDGIWYHHVDTERLNRIYREHLLGGQPVDAYIFHRHFPSGAEPVYVPDLREAEEVDPLVEAAEKSAMQKEQERNKPEPMSPNVAAARARRQERRSQTKSEEA
ncbi:hypothetical protein GC175_28690 [bacterium]|nr:hypothetical protein [bacterium]